MASRCRSAASVSALRTYSSTNASSNCFCGPSRSPAGRPSNRLRLLRRPTPVSTSEKNGSVDTTATLACSGWSEATRSSPRNPSWLSTANPAYGPVKSSNGCAPRNNGAAVTRPSAQVKVAPRWWPVSNQAHAFDGVASGSRPWRIMLQVFQFRRPQNVVVTHDRCDLVVALAAGGRAEEIVQPAPAVHAERADIHSNPRNKRDRQIAPRRPLIRFERERDRLARGFVERGEKGGGGVAHAPCSIGVCGRRLAGALRNGFAQLPGQQNRGGNAQPKMSSVHGAFPLFLNDPRTLTLASLTLASSNGHCAPINSA